MASARKPDREAGSNSSSRRPKTFPKSKPSRISKSEFSYVKSVSNDLDETIESLAEIPVPSHRRSFCKSLKLSKANFKVKRYARALWKYCQNMSSRYESINTNLEFPVFPERCGRLTHVSAKIWILTFAIQDISSEILKSNTDKDDLSKAFSELVQECAITKKILRDFTSKFLQLTFSSVQRLKISAVRLDLKFTGKRRTVVELETKPAEVQKSIKEMVLTGSKVESDGMFHLLRLYMRTNDKRKWFKFASKSNGNHLNTITKGLEEVTSTLQTIRTQIQGLNNYMDLPDSCFHKTLNSITIRIAKEVDKMSQLADGMMFSKIAQVGTTIRKCGMLINSLQLNGKKFVVQILEVVVMTGICCKFVIDQLQIPLKLTQIGPIANAGEDEHDEWEYEVTDFYKTGYPDILRKVPVIINQNELSLHKHIPEEES